MLLPKTLLFREKVPWVKKRDKDFDVPMGYDSAEVCEIVGSYILNLLSNIFDKDIAGLYRDDGLAKEIYPVLKLKGKESP